MLTSEDIGILRKYFLSGVTQSQRREFASHIKNAFLVKLLLSLESTFVAPAGQEQALQGIARSFGIEGHLDELKDIRTSFYQEIATQHLLENNEDAIELLNAKNKDFISILDETRHIHEAFRLIEKNRLKMEFRQLEEELGRPYVGEEEEMVAAFRNMERNELKVQFEELEEEMMMAAEPAANYSKIYPSAARRAHVSDNKNRRTFSGVIKWASLAAAACLILLIWQPQKSSGGQLFDQYLEESHELVPSISSAALESYSDEGDYRGGEQVIKNFTQQESEQIFSAIEMLEKRDFLNAKRMLLSAGVSRGKSPEMLVYLAIAQLNTNEVELGVANLEYLNNEANHVLGEEGKFHLAMAYLKTGEKLKGKTILKSLVEQKSKYSDQAGKFLKELR